MQAVIWSALQDRVTLVTSRRPSALPGVATFALRKGAVQPESASQLHVNLSNAILIPQQRPLTQIKHNSLFGTERSLLLAQKVNNSQRYA